MRFILLGGFLGAGKTTAIARLAGRYQRRGLKVGIVTNDQATDLVDTHLLRAQGYQVGEVPGACFCCHFDDLTRTVAELEGNNPDIILAEPVGSCTDLAATVIQPLRHLHADRFSIAPYGVILKPNHGARILARRSGGGFSAKAAYIFEKQLEEADVVLLNRIDELSPIRADELVALVERQVPGVPVLRVSARTGEGFDALDDFLDQEGEFGRRILDLDYDTYAEGEAELGWLNSSLRIRSEQPIELDDVLLALVTRLKAALASEGAEPAHLKTIGLWQGFYGVANLIGSDADPVLSLPANCRVTDADVIINARVAIDPDLLRAHVESVVASIAGDLHAQAEFRSTQHFRPGRPVPTHRYSKVGGE